jgi:phosphate:Na+ symporter
MIGTTFEILGSLGMFLFGMRVMSEALQKLSGERLRGMMRALTTNRFAGIGTGFVVTCLVQSSSATTVMIVSFVNAGLLTVLEAIGMIMGANLGTTTTFWIVSYLGFKFSVSAIALPIIGVALPLVFSRKALLRDSGEFLIGFGLLFLGLMFLKDSVPDIQNNPEALEFIQKYTGHGIFSVLFFFVFGTLLTIGVQSSSVAGAITITMAFKGWIDYPSAAAIILGENVGTTITANIAALGASTNARRAARAHLVFNLIGVLWAILLFQPFLRLVDAIMPGDASVPENIPQHMAAFHSLFNLTNIALLVGFVPHLARLVERLVEPTLAKGAEHVTFESPFMPRTGELNIAEAEKDVQRMGDLTRELLVGFIELLQNPDKDLSNRVRHLKKLEQESDRLAYETTTYMLRLSSASVSEATMGKITSLIRVVAELEDICDRGYRLVLLAERKYRKKRELPPETVEQVRRFSDLVLQFMDFYSTRLNRPIDTADMETAYQLENQIDDMRKALRRASMSRMRESGEVVKAEMLYIDILNNMESIGNHSLNILQALRHRD